MFELVLEWLVHDQPHTYTVRQAEETAIGRRDDCQVVLPFATISRRHALVYAHEGTFYVRNLSQTNTVRVNDDNRLGYEESASLRPGDILRLGPVEIHIKANKALEEMQNRTLKIRCSNCGQVTDYKPESFCPWCGMSLAGSQTVIG